MTERKCRKEGGKTQTKKGGKKIRTMTTETNKKNSGKQNKISQNQEDK